MGPTQTHTHTQRERERERETHTHTQLFPGHSSSQQSQGLAGVGTSCVTESAAVWTRRSDWHELRPLTICFLFLPCVVCSRFLLFCLVLD